MAKKKASSRFSDFESYDSKQMKAFIQSVKEAQKELSSLGEIADGFSSSLLGISVSAFNKQVPKSVSEIRDSFIAANRALSEMKILQADLASSLTTSTSNQRSAVDSFTTSMRNAMNSIASSLGNANEMANVISNMAKYGKDFNFEKLNSEEQAALLRVMNSEAFDFLDRSMSINDQINIMSDLISGSGDDLVSNNAEIAEMIARHRSLGGVLNNNLETIRRSRMEYERRNDEARETTRNGDIIERIANYYKEWSSSFLRNVGKSFTEANQTFKELQRNSGIDMTINFENSGRIADWSMKMTQFGMSTKDSTEMLSELSDQLKTTNRETLMDSAERLSAIPMALGLSVKEATEFSGELMRAGHSAEQVEDYFRLANKNAKFLGVNSRAVVKQIIGNIDKMRQFGFAGGEKSLIRMAAKAEMLRIKVDSIFDVAKKARTIEGAMDMAAQLQLAGGSFSRINPMELLSAARKGPEELGKILTSMGDDIGSWVTDMNGNKTFQFNPLDVGRLEIAAEATGMELDQLQKMIQKKAEISEKTSWIGGDDMFRGVSEGIEGMDAQLAKARISDLLTMGKNGQLSIDTSKLKKKDIKLLDQVGIRSMADLNETNIKELLELDAKEKANLEEQAQQNISLKESLDAFVASLTNAFIAFQPAIEWLTKGINQLNSMGSIGKSLVAGSIVAIGLWKTGMIGMIKDFGSGVAGIFSRLKGLGGGVTNTGTGAGMTGLAGNMSSAANIAQSISPRGIAMFGLALATMGAAVIGFTYALDKIGGEPSLEKLGAAAASMAILGGGLALSSRLAGNINPKGILSLSLAMGVVGLAMVPFAYAAQEMVGVDWGSVLKGLGLMGLSMAALAGIGSLMTAGLAIPLAAGAAALIGVGASLYIASQGILASGLAFEKLTKIDWSGMDKMGSAMMKVAPALGLFAFSAMAFANPIALIGIAAMTVSLWGLSKVIVPMVSQFDKSSMSITKMNESILSLVQSFDPVAILSIFGAIGIGIKEMDKSMKGVDTSDLSKKLSSIKVGFDTSSFDEIGKRLSGIKDLTINVIPSVDTKGIPEIMMKAGFDSDEIRNSISKISSEKIDISSKLSISNIDAISNEIKSLSSNEIFVRLNGVENIINSISELRSLSQENAQSSKSYSNSAIGLDDAQIMSDISKYKIGVDESQMMNLVSKYKIGVDVEQFNQLSNSLQANDLVASIAQFSAKVKELTVDRLSVVNSDNMGDKNPTRNDEEMAVIEKLYSVMEKLNETMSRKPSQDQGVAKIKLDLKMNGKDIKYRIMEDTKLLV